jgi:YbaB/EbfC DNA-binding family
MTNGIDAAEDWLDDWTAGISAQAERAATLSRRVAALTASAESADGSIKVTVGSAGQVESLDLDDAELARRILSVMRKAQSNLARQVTAQVQDTVGADTETGRAVIDSFELRFPQRESSEDDGGADRGR